MFLGFAAVFPACPLHAHMSSPGCSSLLLGLSILIACICYWFFFMYCTALHCLVLHCIDMALPKGLYGYKYDHLCRLRVFGSAHDVYCFTVSCHATSTVLCLIALSCSMLGSCIAMLYASYICFNCTDLFAHSDLCCSTLATCV